jgi:hypothetical protein
MTEPARPAEDRPPGSVRPAIRAGLRGGVLAFAVATCVGVAIALTEYAVSGGAYRLWTWVKVAFLYVVSFCTASLRVTLLAPRAGDARAPEEIVLRFSFLLGTLLVLWLLSLAGRRVAGDGAGAGAIVAGAAAAVAGFAAPVFAIALPATLRFPGLLHAEVSPILWEAAVYPMAVAIAGIGAGVFVERRDRIAPATAAIVRGGWRMFVLSLMLAVVGLLGLAAAKPGPTGAYARELQAEGRIGVLSFTHQLLLLPNQALWILAPSMGGSTEVSFGGRDRSTVAIGRADLGSTASTIGGGVAAAPSIPLGGGFYLFLLVPAVATVLGGRTAGRTGARWIGRIGRGAGAGVAFAVFVAAGAWASGATIPIPALGWAPVSIDAAMPSTVMFALVWGVAGGALGGLSSGFAAPRASGRGAGA